MSWNRGRTSPFKSDIWERPSADWSQSSPPSKKVRGKSRLALPCLLCRSLCGRDATFRNTVKDENLWRGARLRTIEATAKTASSCLFVLLWRPIMGPWTNAPAVKASGGKSSPWSQPDDEPLFYSAAMPAPPPGPAC